MKRSTAVSTLLALTFLVLFPLPARALNSFGISVNLTHLGGDRYRYTFHMTNLGPDLDVIFKWEYKVDSKWDSEGFGLPFGWGAHKAGTNLLFQISGGNKGPHRIRRGETKTFIWTFRRDNGAAPTTDWSGKVHFQPVEDYVDYKNNGPSYTQTSPGVVPEPNALVLLGAGLLGLGAYGRFRRRRED